MSLTRTRPSFAMGLLLSETEVPVPVGLCLASRAVSWRLGWLRWLRDLRSPLVFRSLRRSVGVPDENLLFALPGRLRLSGVCRRLMISGVLRSLRGVWVSMRCGVDIRLISPDDLRSSGLSLRLPLREIFSYPLAARLTAPAAPGAIEGGGKLRAEGLGFS